MCKLFRHLRTLCIDLLWPWNPTSNHTRQAKMQYWRNHLISSFTESFSSSEIIQKINSNKHTTYQTLAGYANVGTFLFVTSRTVDDFAPVTIIKSLAFRHAIQLALVGRSCIRNPPVNPQLNSSSSQIHKIWLHHPNKKEKRTRSSDFQMVRHWIGNIVPTGNLVCRPGSPI